MHRMGPQRCSVLSFIFLAASVYCKSPTISIIPPNGEVYLGSTKYFMCKVTSGGDAALRWTTADDEDIEDEEGRYTLKKVDESVSGLFVTSLRVEAEKVIKCHGEFDSGEKSEAELKIRVIKRPQFVGDSPMDKEYDAGASAKLPCSATGIPAPKVSWIRDGKTVSLSRGHLYVSADGTLNIDKIQLSDAGTYSCLAYIQERQEAEYKNVSITVNAAPAVQFQNDCQNATSVSNTSLVCQVTGHPRPTVTWKRGTELVEHDGQKYILSVDGRELSILQVDKSDEGEYTCNAINRLGQESNTLLLRVIEPERGSLGKGVVTGIVLLVLLVLLLAIDLTCYRTKRRGFLMCIATNLLGKQTPGVKMQETENKKGSAHKSHVVNISGIDA
ncbi:hypothetical protein FKM82_013151 [Ascaphus truei]